ncbi:YbbR domain-containing protein [Pelagirhabdus alkalitolerans]|uniref:YbbR domain-containing protein n=1 Tax=Pelagirhabdus alkalitolerans TaxID=1612202 RepID=A0A1G6K0H5_9BACI|nr:CdaR family protein [Pelagirhabdus alkalitolerans]SDC24474.1 YbbR domain-containing protein [Pelagirhabdus alkalitolerans]
MNDWLNKPWVIRIVSLFLAVLTFFVISFDNQDMRTADIGGLDSIFNNSQETEILEDVPVNIMIDEEEYVVSGVPEFVTMTLEGTVSVVQSTATQRNFDVFVDLEGLEPGTHVVPIEYDGISNRLNVGIEPSQVEISIEERATETFDVQVDYTNEEQIEPGFEIVSENVSPGTVQVTSSESVIDRISVVKVYVDVEGIGESLEITDVPVRVYDNEGNQLNARIEPETVSIDLEVASPHESVPINIDTTGELPDNLQLTSIESDIDEVDVYASEDDLETITEIDTEPIDLSEITESTTIDVDLVMPDNARMLSQNSITLNVEVEETTDVTIENVEIDVDNLSDDLTATILDPDTGVIDVSINGFPSEISDLDAASFELVVDLDGFNVGEYEVPIEIEEPEDVDASLEQEEAVVEIE